MLKKLSEKVLMKGYESLRISYLHDKLVPNKELKLPKINMFTEHEYKKHHVAVTDK